MSEKGKFLRMPYHDFLRGQRQFIDGLVAYHDVMLDGGSRRIVFDSESQASSFMLSFDSIVLLRENEDE